VSSLFARAVVRARVLVVAGWIAAAAAATVYLPGLAEAEGSPLGGLVAADAGALDVEERSARTFGVPILSRVAVVQRDPTGLSAPELARLVRRAVRVNTRDDPLLATIRFALPIANTAALLPGSREAGTTAITYLYFEPDASLRARDALGHTYASRIAADGDHLVGVTGPIPARLEQWEAIEGALPLVEVATVALIALVLGLAFRAPGPPLIALAAAAIAYLVSVRVVAWLGIELGLTVPREVEPVMVVLLLGVVTDYAVFFVAGARRRLRESGDARAATIETTTQYAPIVATAGLIVVCGTATLLVGRLEFFRALGPGAAVTVAVALVVSLTFVPALLALLGRHAYRPSLGRRTLDEEGAPPGWQARAVRLASARPVALVLAVVVVAALLLAARPVRDADLGVTVMRGLPEGAEPRVAAAAAAKGFAAGILSPTELFLTGPGLRERTPELVRLQRLIERQPGVAAVIGPRELPPQIGLDAFVAADGSAARYAIVFDRGPLSAQALDALRALERRLPRLLAAAGLPAAEAALAGDTALAAGTVASAEADIRRVAVAALLVNLALLALFLRALVAPLYLVAASALSLAAALGLTAAVFEGWLGNVDLTYYVPFAAAVLLLSLGSDYNLFVVGRVWQEAERLPLRDALAYAVPRASATITVAGITLAFSFALLALVPLLPFREFAFLMCIGVLLETFVVRTILVPSLIALAGDASWWPGRRRPPADV
jgi:RND superfamily putative drug exporter